VSGHGSIDIHAHFYPEAFLKLVAAEGGRFGAGAETDDPDRLSLTTDGRSRPVQRRMVDVDLRIAEMDRAGVEVHALSLTTPMVDWADGKLAAALAATYNDAVAEAHTAYPDRLVGLAALPWRYPELAVAELERAARHPGIRGAYAPTQVEGRDLDDEAFRPVFERIEDLGWTLFLHPVRVVEPERLAPFYLTNLLGNPFESAIAGAKLIFGGVLDRHPRLEVCLPHGGGALPSVIGRLDHGRNVRPELAHREQDASAYLKRFYFDTVTHSAKVLGYLIDLVGADRVMLGSDYCFDMGYERPVEVVTGHAGLDDAARAQILGGTARRLLKLG